MQDLQTTNKRAIGRMYWLLIGSLGAIAIALITLILDAGDNLGRWRMAESLKGDIDRDTELQIKQAEAKRRIAEEFAQNGVAQYNSIRIRYYYRNSSNPPNFDWNKEVVTPQQKTWVFDHNNTCVGFALDGQLYTDIDFRGVANTIYNPAACKLPNS